MTATDTDIPALAVETAPLEAVTFDFYRDIHKGIRNELFAITYEAGRVDPGNAAAVQALAGRWRSMSSILVSHAEHEEVHVQPVLEGVAPELAVQVIPVHRELEARAAGLEVLADRAGNACPDDARLVVHRLYLGLAGFTSAYLAHQEFEELSVMPALCAAVPVDDLVAIDMAIVGGLSPEEMVQSATIMLPAMNVEDRVELVGAMKEGMPPEVFAGVWSLGESVLGPADATQLAGRLGIS
jgi:iron-sulfur cluster repair protein YtfE (RIC family)